MSEDKVLYDSDKHSYSDLLQSNKRGIKFLCPTCHSELLIINSKKLVRKYRKPQGIFCPKNDNHVWIKFILTEERNFWERLEKSTDKTSGNND